MRTVALAIIEMFAFVALMGIVLSILFMLSGPVR